MAPAETTTLRMPKPLRDEIARLADQRGTSMVDVVTDAVRNLRCDAWWAEVHVAFDAMAPAEVAAYDTEASGLEGSGLDGLDDR